MVQEANSEGRNKERGKERRRRSWWGGEGEGSQLDKDGDELADILDVMMAARGSLSGTVVTSCSGSFPRRSDAPVAVALLLPPSFSSPPSHPFLSVGWRRKLEKPRVVWKGEQRLLAGAIYSPRLGLGQWGAGWPRATSHPRRARTRVSWRPSNGPEVGFRGHGGAGRRER